MSRTCKCAVSGKTRNLDIMSEVFLDHKRYLFIHIIKKDKTTPYCACMHGVINLTTTWLHYVIVGVKACAVSTSILKYRVSSFRYCVLLTGSWASTEWEMKIE